MFSQFFKFELNYRLGKASTYLYAAIFFLLGFIAITAAAGVFKGGVVGVSAGGKRAFINSPFYLLMITNTYSLFGIILMASFMGRAVCRDYETRMYQLFFTRPIRKGAYFAGRFAGTFVILLGILVFLGLGLYAGGRMPWIRPEVLGTTHLWYHVYPFLVGVLPNLFIVGGISFSLAVFTRRMLPVYISAVVLFMTVMVMIPALADLQQNSLVGLIDPFGSGIFLNYTKYWTYVDQNTRMVPFRGIFMLNRLIWVGLSALLMGLAYGRFSLAMPGQKNSRIRTPALPTA
jgi:ABC-2 type transport system permease protein